jgi:hypothetical protein
MLARASIFRAAFKISKPTSSTITLNSRPFSTTTHPRLAMAAPTDTQAAAEANASGVTAESISATLKSKLDASHVEIEDMSGKPHLR